MSEPTFCTEAAPPLDETEALAAISLAFGLRHNEAQVLLSLMTHGFRTLEQLRAVTNHSAETSTISVTIHTMRKKLKPRGIEVVNVETGLRAPKGIPR